MNDSASIELLRKLGSGVTPAGARSASPAEGDAFADLLARAQRGELSSGRDVRPSPTVDAALTPEQTERLSRAVDAAEAAGAHRIAAFLDGRAMRIDVARRVIESAHAPGAHGAEIVEGVDAAVALGDGEAGEGGDAALAPALRWRGVGGVRNPSLARLLDGGSGG